MSLPSAHGGRLSFRSPFVTAYLLVLQRKGMTKKGLFFMASFIVRPPATAEEFATHFQGDLLAFEQREDPAEAARWQENTFNAPGFRLEQLRCVFLDGQQAGGCIVHERELRVGPARVLTGCIGGVFTRPEFRHRGIAAALMRDVIDFARERHYALLLLDGIPNFYYRYGYCDVFDISTQEIFREAILALPASPYTLRPVTAQDAPALLALYERHFGAYTGSFARSLEQQQYQLQNREPATANLSWFAVDAQEQVRGYLSLDKKDKCAALEFAADDWEAALALLQHHAHLLDGFRTLQSLRYLLPDFAPVTQWLAEHLRIANTANSEHSFYNWTIMGQTYHQNPAGWMGRVVDVPALAQTILPAWQERWQRSLARWSGDVVLNIQTDTPAEQHVVLHIVNDTVQVLDEPSTDATHIINLTAQALVQLLFGYRSIAQLAPAMQPALAQDVQSVLSILFPTGNAWITRSDWF